MEDVDESKLAQGIERLLSELKVHDWSTTWRVSDQLAKTGPAAVPRLITALIDKDGYVRSAAAEALGKIGDARAVDPLIAAMQYRDEQIYEDNEDGEARLNAALALGKIGDLRAMSALLEVASSKDLLLASYAIDALGMLGDTRSIPTLIDALHVHDQDVPKAACNALIRIGAPAVRPLIQSLQSSEGYWRLHALRALGGIGDRRALDSVQSLLDDPDEYVRMNAAQALAAIQKKNSAED